MLVLTRKISEQILIGDDIKIIITNVSRNRVSIAIDAPMDIAVRRSELNRLPQEEFVGVVVGDQNAVVLDDETMLTV